jgi:hypothetical protein
MKTYLKNISRKTAKNLVEKMNMQVQEAFKIPSIHDQKSTSTFHIIVTILST